MYRRKLDIRDHKSGLADRLSHGLRRAQNCNQACRETGHANVRELPTRAAADSASEIAQIAKVAVVQGSKCVTVEVPARREAPGQREAPGDAGAPAQYLGRIAPEWLRDGVAHVVARQADIGEQVVVMIGERGNVATMLRCLMK